ncbi:MAG: molybdate ABC transporter permease subunit [Acidimicrobiia bacterium]|nr:molybdate ABC transporter permease subunit [Acidimicrobiia bacterium]
MTRAGLRRVPRSVGVLAAVGLAFLVMPVVGLLQRAPWSSLPELLGSEAVLDALGLSVVVSLAASAIAFVLGLPLALVLARVELPGMRLIRALVLLPMVLPPVVGGTALLFALGRRGLVGQWLDRWFDLTLPFTTAGAIVAATFVSMPFFVITVEAALRQAGTDLDEAAATLGASPLRVLLRVTLPQITPALAAGAALTWARALGEFGATVAFAGNLPGRTQTLPLATFVALESDPERALALALVLLAVSLTVLIALRDRIVIR